MSESTVDVKILHFADPFCFWSWAFEGVFQRLQNVYGDRLQMVHVQGAAVEDIEGWKSTYGVDWKGTRDWCQRVIDQSGMPFNPNYLQDSSMQSSWPSCRAIKAAQMQEKPQLIDRFMRKTEEAFMIECLKPTDECHKQLADDVGLDGDRLVADMHSDKTLEMLRADQMTMRRARANFAQIGVEAGGQVALCGGVFEGPPVEKVVEKLVPGITRHEPKNLLDHLVRMPGNLIHDHELSVVFRISKAQAHERMNTLAKHGIVEERQFPFASYWVPQPFDRNDVTEEVAAAAQL